MLKFIAPTLVTATFGLGFALPASAATEVGTLMNVDATDAQVTLIDGETFTFPDTPVYQVHLAEFRPGDVVAIAADGNGSTKWSADAMWLDEPVTGYSVP